MAQEKFSGSFDSSSRPCPFANSGSGFLVVAQDDRGLGCGLTATAEEVEEKAFSIRIFIFTGAKARRIWSTDGTTESRALTLVPPKETFPRHRQRAKTGTRRGPPGCATRA